MGNEPTGFHRRGVMAGPSISRIKKLIFFAPSKCPIDLFGLVQQQLGSESREGCAYIRVDAPKQVLALQRVLVRAKMPDAVRGAWVDDEFRRRRPPAGQLERVVEQGVAGPHRKQRRREVVG